MATPRSRPTPSPHPTSILIEIPANEFPTARTPPPPQANRRPPSNRARRRADAEHLRNAALQSMSHRCREHVEYAASVATAVKASRRASARARHQALASTLESAHQRRQQLLSRRAEPCDTRARRARSAQQRKEHLRRSFETRHQKAGERRRRILSERKERAARFSPSRADSPLNSPAVSASSPSSMSVGSNDDVTRALEFSDNSFGDARCLPQSVADATDRALRVDDSESDSDDDDDSYKTRAASRIASYYLLAKARRALTAAGILGPELPSYSFAQVTSCLESDNAQEAAELVFRALGLRERAADADAHTAREQRDGRVLLSCLLITLHPDAVLEGKGRSSDTQEAMTLYTARRMLLCLQAGTLPALASAWVMWRNAFKAWKKRDAENMLRAMIEDAVATEAMRVAVNRGFSQSANVQALKSVLGARETELDTSQQEHAVWEQQIARKQDLIREGVIKLAGEAGGRRLDLALSASSHAQNERMVHEILVDLPGLLERIRNPVPIPEETWERLRTELSANPPVRDELAARLAHISTSLNTMMANSFTLDNEEGSFDLDADFAIAVVSKAAEALKKSQAQAFDDALEEWLEDAVERLHFAGQDLVLVTVSILKELTELIRGVQTDVLVYRVRHSAPIVHQYGAAWERSHFQGHIVTQEFSKDLPRTRQLVSSVLDSLDGHEISTAENARRGDTLALRMLVTRGVVQLSAKMEMCSEEELPELLFLDHERIVKLQNEVQRCSLVGSLDNIGRQYLRSKGLPVGACERVEMLEVTARDNTTLRDIQDAFLQWIRSETERCQENISDADEQLLRNMVERTTSPSDKTFGIVHRRVKDAIVELSEKMASLRARTTAAGSSTSESLQHSQKGLEGVDRIVHSVSSNICSLVLHVLSVHGESLLEVLRTL